MKLNIIILAGGMGERLWPLVNKENPKPLLKLNREKTLLEATIERYCDLGNVFLVMTKEQIKIAKRVLPHNKVEYIEEISPSGTSVAMRLAANQFLGKELLLFAHADQLFDDQEDLCEAIQNGILKAQEGRFVLFGTKPTSANTQLGYFRLVDNHIVDTFYEKPSKEEAQNLVKEKNIFWNTGIVLVRADVLIETWEKHFNPERRSFEHSILMNVSNISAITIDSAFVDIGQFETIESFLGLRIGSNYLSENVATKQVTNSLIYSESLPVKVIDIENLIVVATKHGILITKRGKSATQKELPVSKRN